MSKTIYYIGAGASYGIRDKDTGAIIEGIPVVAEIPAEFDAFRRFIAEAVIPEGFIEFWGMYRTGHNDVVNAQRYMLSDIDGLIQGIKEHATIDTYARKLFLTMQRQSFEKLKGVLCAFFLWEQLEHKPDGRYDTFFANVLEAGTLDLPKDISVISWNYDSQMETAFEAYRKRPELTVFEKNIQGDWPILPNKGCLFKVNGSATFANSQIVSVIKQYSEPSIAVQLIQLYSNTMADTTSMGFQFKTHLSFAWENSPNNDNMMNTLGEVSKNTEQIIVIGYSFPFFNRETDRAILRGMPNLKKIYIQDVRPDAVMQSIAAVLPENSKIDIVPIRDCAQFYLPAEL